MGVRSVSHLLKGCRVDKYRSLDAFFASVDRPFVVAIDAFLYMVKYSVSLGDVPFGIINQCHYLLSRGIFPIYVLDSSDYPIQKSSVQKTRKRKCLQRGGSPGVNKQTIRDTTMILQAMGIPVIQAPREADSLCARLCVAGLVDGCLSDDMDIAILGCNTLIRRENTGEIGIYGHDSIVHQLGIKDTASLKRLAVLLGCDYGKGVRSNASDILQAVRQTDCINDALCLLKSKKRADVFEESISVYEDEIQNADNFIEQKLLPLRCNPASAKDACSLISDMSRTHTRLADITYSYVNFIIRRKDHITSLMMGDRHRCMYPRDATEYLISSG